MNEQFKFIYDLIIVNVRETMDCVRETIDCMEKFSDCTDGNNIKPHIAIAFFNKSLYHMSIAKTSYMLYYSEFGRNDSDDFFEAYENFTKDFLYNYEQTNRHEWKIKSFQELEDCYKCSEFTEPKT